MNNYGQFCPVARAADVLGERWTFLVIRELMSGSRHFNDIHRGVPRMSRTLLSQRLRALARAGVVRREDAAGRVTYDLTRAGRDLRPVIQMLGSWGTRWLDGAPADEELDPHMLLWELKRTSGPVSLAESTVLVRFELMDRPDYRFAQWAVGPDGRIDVMRSGRGREADLVVRAPMRTLVDVWLRREPLEDATRDGQIELRGEPDLARRFCSWLGRSPYAPEQTA